MPERHRHSPVPAGEVFLKGVLVQNPVLVQLIGICPVAAAAVSLRAGVLLAAVSSLIIIATHVAASAFLKNIIRWVRVAVYLLIGLAFIAPAGWLLEQYQPDLRRTLGIYLPLLAANSLIALRCEKVAVRSSVKHSLLDSIAVSIGYSAVILLTGFIRELLGNGEILEKPVRFLPAAPGLLLPFGGFLVLGFMAAALKGIVMRHFPKYAKDMGVEISPTAVTMKLKPEDEINPTEREPELTEPLPATPEPAFIAPEDTEPKEQADRSPPAVESQPEVISPAAPPEEPAPAQSPLAPAADNDIDLKLKELFNYLNELEKETKDTQGE